MIIKKPNNDHITHAIDILDIDKTIVKNGKIDSTFKSYISSFGGSIIQSGLQGTLMTFEANDSKKKIINLLFEVHNASFITDTINQTNGAYYRTIKTKSEAEKKLIRNRLVEMAVAVKLAMRCFETNENEQ